MLAWPRGGEGVHSFRHTFMSSGIQIRRLRWFSQSHPDYARWSQSPPFQIKYVVYLVIPFYSSFLVFSHHRSLFHFRVVSSKSGDGGEGCGGRGLQALTDPTFGSINDFVLFPDYETFISRCRLRGLNLPIQIAGSWFWVQIVGLLILRSRLRGPWFFILARRGASDFYSPDDDVWIMRPDDRIRNAGPRCWALTAESRSRRPFFVQMRWNDVVVWRC